MLIKRTIKSGVVDTLNVTGKYFTFLRAEVGTRLRLSLLGRSIIDSEMTQGMSLQEVRFDKVEIISDSHQTVEFWASEIKFKSEPETSSRAKTIKGYQKSIGPFVNSMLEVDVQRVLAKITSDNDIYIGGEDLSVNNGLVSNAAFYKAGVEFSFTPYGAAKCFWSEKVGQDFAAQVSPMPYINDTQPGITRTYLESLNFPFVDILIPPELDNVGINLILKASPAVSGDINFGAAIWFTDGDTSTEALTKKTFLLGVGDFSAGIEGTRNVAFSKGSHRIFFADYLGNTTTKATGTASQIIINALTTDEPLMSPTAILNILEERL